MSSDRGKSTIIAAMMASSVTILAIGVLNFMGEASEAFNESLIFWQAMGPLSGKVALAYAFGVVVFLALFRIKPLGRHSLVGWTIVLHASIALSAFLLLIVFFGLVL